MIIFEEIGTNNQFSLADFGLMLQKGHSHPTPSTKDKTISIPGKFGLLDFGAEMSERQFQLPLTIIEINNSELQMRIRKFVSFLLDSYGKPKTFKLSFEYETNMFYFVRYSGQISPSRLFGIGTFNLPLTAYDPFAYSKANNDDINWGSENITFENNLYTFGHTGGGEEREITFPTSFAVFVSGLIVKPVIILSGTGTNVVCSVNGRSFSIGTFSNAEWRIDGENWTVLKNGTNGLSDYNKNYPSGDWLEFLPGENNFSIDGSGLNLTVQIKFRDKLM